MGEVVIEALVETVFVVPVNKANYLYYADLNLKMQLIRLAHCFVWRKLLYLSHKSYWTELCSYPRHSLKFINYSALSC